MRVIEFMNSSKVGVIVLNLNGAGVLENCLRSIEKISYPNVEVVVVDNGSTDGSASIVEEKFPDFRLVENGKNLGVPEGHNVGIRHCLQLGAEFILALNNDLIVDRDVVNELLRCSMDSSIGISGPIIYCADKPQVVQTAGGIIRWTGGSVSHLLAGETTVPACEAFDVDYVQFQFIRTDILRRIGFFDPDYFAYWEDVDLCIRAKRAGYRVVSVPTARVWHEGSHTAKKMRGLIPYYMVRNRFRFMKKWATGAQYSVFVAYFSFFEFWRELLTQLVPMWDAGSLGAFLRGTLDGLSYHPGGVGNIK